MTARIAVVGDFDPGNPTHGFTNAALDHVHLGFEWVPTDAIGDDAEPRLAAFDGLWIAPASPQARSSAAAPHPLLVGFAAAVTASRRDTTDGRRHLRPP